jgi:5-methylcytosine-specific restriction protein B
MSRRPTSDDHPQVIAAAQHWRDVCLLRGDSAFTAKTLWSAEHIADLKGRIVDRPDVGKDSFEAKLVRQLEGASTSVIQLAAEIVWVLRLFPCTGDIGVARKRQLINSIWSLSKESLPATDWLSDDALQGVGGSGHAFRSRLWHQISYLLRAMADWSTLPTERRHTLLARDDPWAFCDWLTAIEGGKTSETRHALLFFAYPDYFERICSGSHKRRIYQAFRSRLSPETAISEKSELAPCELDRAILGIRKSFEAERATTQFDFYLPDIEPLWSEPAPPPAPTPSPKPKTDGGTAPAEQGTPATDPFNGVFLERETWDLMLAVWRARKNIVLQGPPGVGKSFIGDRLALELCGGVGAQRMMRVQFHPATSYEDFVQGYRPDGKGGFVMREGPFVRFCQAAQKDVNQPYVFVIDELNRGNLARILGELMMLIEHDKRGTHWQMPLSYSEAAAEPFYVPENVHIVGLMNSADRSLAMVDYALRRRFAFFTLTPAFSAQGFAEALKAKGVTPEMVARIRERMQAVNEAITATLGAGYAVGHSFFTSGPASGESEEDWYSRIIAYEVGPLLDEYWFDDVEQATKWRSLLEAD